MQYLSQSLSYMTKSRTSRKHSTFVGRQAFAVAVAGAGATEKKRRAEAQPQGGLEMGLAKRRPLESSETGRQKAGSQRLTLHRPSQKVRCSFEEPNTTYGCYYLT